MQQSSESPTILAPKWFHKSGTKVRLSNTPDKGAELYLLAPKLVAQVWIRKRPSGARKRYLLDWNNNHTGGFDMPFTAGRIEVTDAELMEAFNLSKFSDQSVVPGKFVRFHNYLNIPGRGEGRDGDANLSVYISEAIRQAVRDMLAKDSRRSFVA